ncbi:S-adenosyl-L-methionine-dependent methyltransferase [Piedraia hortae CBS 480.64]|uniref:S-adenosyl-L-methionine-dependent methyltransferase n=1 Tax=Piedraia hortae CBS 480.64 TaxID=1314780 RepID=A0A6A7C7W7_9PEZI|nr:S-adenosyl-L-methionine-dependent methyltransferase [Piedraia hortae CBS 480.64]
MPLHHSAQTGFAASKNYDLYRPSYSHTVVQYVLDKAGVAGRQHAAILDLAAGTGKFTELLARREEGYDIVAVEPHDQMREVLTEKGLKGVKILKGAAEDIPLEDESMDAVIVAQVGHSVCSWAFHWFATEDSLKELKRVLKPRGMLVLVWNIEDYNAARDHNAATPWESRVHQLTWSFDDNESRFRHEKWRQVFDDQLESSPLALVKGGKDVYFSLPLGEHVEPFETWMDKDRVWDRYSTLSHISVLQGERREKTRREVMDALQDAKKNIKGEVAVHGNTYIVWTSKVPQEGKKNVFSVEDPAKAT